MKLTKIFTPNIVNLSHLLPAPLSGTLYAYRENGLAFLQAVITAPVRETATRIDIPTGYRPPWTLNAVLDSWPTGVNSPYLLTVGQLYIPPGAALSNARFSISTITLNAPPLSS